MARNRLLEFLHGTEMGLGVGGDISAYVGVNLDVPS